MTTLEHQFNITTSTLFEEIADVVLSNGDQEDVIYISDDGPVTIKAIVRQSVLPVAANLANAKTNQRFNRTSILIRASDAEAMRASQHLMIRGKDMIIPAGAIYPDGRSLVRVEVRPA